MSDARLTLEINAAGSPRRRISLDAAGGDRPGSLSFSSTVPGGFESGSIDLARRAGIDHYDLKLLSGVRVLGPGGEVAWEGRIDSVQPTTGQVEEVSVGMVGWQAALEDEQHAKAIYIDRSLERWGGMSRSRQLTAIGTTVKGIGDGETADDSSEPGVSLVYDGGSWAANYGPRIEAWYDAGGPMLIAKVVADLSRDALAAFYSATSLRATIQGGAADNTTTQWTAALGDGPVSLTFSPSVRFAMLEMFWNNTGALAVGDNVTFMVNFRNICVCGPDVPIQGTGTSLSVYASDVIKHAVATFAPLLNLDIQPTGFGIPHLAFHDDTTPAEIVRAANAYHLYDWAVWDDRTFCYYPRDSRGRVWRARVGEAHLQEAGPQVDNTWNGVVVTYQDVDGSSKSVGPPGALTDSTNTLLADPDSSNPATSAGVRRWGQLDMGMVSTPAAAVEAGSRFLIQQRQTNRAGSAELHGTVEDDHGVKRPVWQVRAGDRIRFVDARDDAERRVVRASYDYSGNVTSVDLDAPPMGMEALLERMSASIKPFGV